MVDYHYAERRLNDWGRNTFVSWSKEPLGKAVIFIHGFNGNPEKAFSEFEVLFRTSNKFIGYDVFFYGYDSLKAPVASSASLFKKFIDQVYDNSVSLFNYSIPAKEKERPKYDKIVIVAHSLGAVVSRTALLQADKDNLSWVNFCSLILFAPAHKGASPTISALISGKAFPGFWKLLAVIPGYQIPTLKELEAGCTLLQELESDTLALITSGKNGFTIAKEVVWAVSEKVVVNKRFGKDPQEKVILQTNHSNVCKPNIKKRFFDPLEIVSKHL